MKKILLLILPLLALGFVATAQLTFDLSKKDYLNMPQDGSFHKAKIAVINNTSTPIDFEWKVLAYSLPQGWSDQGFCDWLSCYGFNQTNLHTPPTLAANSSDTIYATVSRGTSGVDGCAIVRIAYNENGEAAQTIELKWSSFASTNSCWPLAVNGVKKSLVNVYPNPTNNVINLNVVNESVRSVQLSNIIGKQLQSISISSAKSNVYQMSLQSLPEGIYILQFRNEAGKVIGVKRITKK